MGWGAEVITPSLRCALAPLSLQGGGRDGQGATLGWPRCLVSSSMRFPLCSLSPTTSPSEMCVVHSPSLRHCWQGGGYLESWGCHMNSFYTHPLWCMDTTPVCTHTLQNSWGDWLCLIQCPVYHFNTKYSHRRLLLMRS